MQKVTWLILFVKITISMSGECGMEPTARQLIDFRNKTNDLTILWTTSAGKPIEYKDGENSLNTNLLYHPVFYELFTHFSRERIPERVVHAKGGGAFGYFEVTDDVRDICKANFLKEVGKKTPVAVRFSPIIAESGGPDTNQDARGFAVKFYTEEGNFDMVGLNLPNFPIKDPIFFPSFIRCQKRNPATHLKDPIAFWDFITLHPETFNAFINILGDPGIPDGYSHMPGFSVHTYQFVNEFNESYFARFHFLPDGGIKYLTAEEGTKIAGEDPDYNNRLLYNEISKGNYPTWTLYLQVLSLDDVKTAKMDVFDVTRRLPEDQYPLRKVGKLVLNRNPKNYFAEVEQLAFCPSNLVCGILGSPDKLFESRRFSYIDAQNYRLGPNFNKIEVNCPLRTKAFTYNRDGSSPVNGNEKDIPNYTPNSFNGPVASKYCDDVPLIEIIQDQPYNFDQSGELYRQLAEGPRNRLIENIVSRLGHTIPEIQNRALQYFNIIDPDFGYRVEQGLKSNQTNYYRCDADD